ncbi:MAG: hypothetical protein HRU26_02985, partial [Psychroserpens sp.]|nr:hypothetical protein [Psychroserpens sp.]
MRLLGLIFLISLSRQAAFSQVPEKSYIYRNITTEDGLSNNVVYDIIEDHEGYIWIATDHGLNKYDGYGFESYYKSSSDSNSLSSNVVRALVCDQNGGLWVGTKEGLLRYIRLQKKFESFQDFMPASQTNNEVMDLEIDSSGSVWFNTQGGIGYFDPKEIVPNIKLLNVKSTAFVKGQDSILYFNSIDGTISKINSTSKKINIQVKDPALQRQKIYYGKYSRKLWLPTKFNTELNPEVFSTMPQLPNELTCTSFLEISKEIVWLGSNNGLFEFNLKTKSLVRIPLGTSALARQVRSIYQDTKGGVWVGTLGGVYHFDFYRKQFDHSELVEDNKDIIMGLSLGSNG